MSFGLEFQLISRNIYPQSTPYYFQKAIEWRSVAGPTMTIMMMIIMVMVMINDNEEEEEEEEDDDAIMIAGRYMLVIIFPSSLSIPWLANWNLKQWLVYIAFIHFINVCCFKIKYTLYSIFMEDLV